MDKRIAILVGAHVVVFVLASTMAFRNNGPGAQLAFYLGTFTCADRRLLANLIL